MSFLHLSTVTSLRSLLFFCIRILWDFALFAIRDFSRFLAIVVSTSPTSLSFRGRWSHPSTKFHCCAWRWSCRRRSKHVMLRMRCACAAHAANLRMRVTKLSYRVFTSVPCMLHAAFAFSFGVSMPLKRKHLQNFLLPLLLESDPLQR